jgi:1-aminocyclopropane-1-carboxylate deaminase/D-cysteine desulfhydrase-like pyridoxal-dependent ACC family enzyme
MGEALGERADVVITFGAVQSNHCRQTAAAAAKLGLGCDLILLDMVHGRGPAYSTSGNVMLDKLLGARIHQTSPAAAQVKLQELLNAHETAGRRPYVVPLGGSNATGALGYVAAYRELGLQCADQNITVSTIVHAVSSGGTQAGLVAGAAFYDHRTRILGINVSRPDGAGSAENVREIAREVLERLDGVPPGLDRRVEIIDGYLGPGYGIPTDATREALSIAARFEGLILDPVYSGKAFAALIAMIREAKFNADDTVVFLHTGGNAVLPAYGEELAL